MTWAAGVVVAARAAWLLLGSVVVGDGLGLFVALVDVEDALDVVFVGVGVGVLVAVAVLLAVFVGVAVDFADALAVVVDVVGFADGVDVLVGDVVVCGLLADGELLDDFRT